MVSLFIALRYLKAKSSNNFIGFISIVSTLGIALGVLVLITVLSVMNGFGSEIESIILKGTPHITIAGAINKNNISSLTRELMSQESVISTSPYILGQAMLTSGDDFNGVMVRGIEPKLDLLANSIVSGNAADLKSGKFNLVIGKSLANNLGLQVGDKVTLLLPSFKTTPIGVQPRLRRFTVVAIFSINYGYDTSQVFININDAAKLFSMGDNIGGIDLQIIDPITAPKITKDLRSTLDYNYYISDWTQKHANLLAAINMEKTVMLMVLLLIVAVAAFNLVSSLVMLVADKRRDIAVLRVMGMKPKDIMQIFIYQGLLIGIIGTVFGVLLGLLLSYNITDLVNYLQHSFDLDLMPNDVYIINFLPSKVEYQDVLRVSILSVAMSLLATIFPAWRASHVNPAEALRYE